MLPRNQYHKDKPYAHITRNRFCWSSLRYFNRDIQSRYLSQLCNKTFVIADGPNLTQFAKFISSDELLHSWTDFMSDELCKYISGPKHNHIIVAQEKLPVALSSLFKISIQLSLFLLSNLGELRGSEKENKQHSPKPNKNSSPQSIREIEKTQLQQYTPNPSIYTHTHIYIHILNWESWELPITKTKMNCQNNETRKCSWKVKGLSSERSYRDCWRNQYSNNRLDQMLLHFSDTVWKGNSRVEYNSDKFVWFL